MYDIKFVLLYTAVDASQFQPLQRPPSPPKTRARRQAAVAPTPKRVTVVALSRLVYVKGIDLLVIFIPEFCRRNPRVDFLIGAFSYRIWTLFLLILDPCVFGWKSKLHFSSRYVFSGPMNGS